MRFSNRPRQFCAGMWLPGLLGLLFVATSLGCSSISGGARSLSDRVKRISSPSESSDEVVIWDWTLGIPMDAPRAELLAATVPNNAIAQFLPQLQTSQVRLVSTHDAFAGYEIRNVDGTAISNCADLHQALERVTNASGDVQVDLAPVGAPVGTSETALRVDQQTLLALGHSTAQSSAAIRVSEGGNPMLLIRDGGIRANLVVRIERQLGMVQLVMTTSNCWQQDARLPVEVTVKAGESPLHCLTVSAALELLYGDAKAALSEGSSSFATTSEREDYLLPVNYNRLSKQRDPRGIDTQGTALASLGGMHYPGPAMLGDARALTGILMQQELLKSGETSRTGWLIFADESVTSAEHIDVSIDLGSGPKSYRFMVPQSGA